MKYTTTFTGFPSSGIVKNFSTATMTRDINSPIIPEQNVKITKITFNFRARIYGNFTIRAYDVTDSTQANDNGSVLNDRPLKQGNYYIDSAMAPALSETLTLTQEANVKDYSFSGFAEDEITGDKWYKRVYGEDASFKLCFCSTEAIQSNNKAYVYNNEAFSCIVEWQYADQNPNPPTNVTASTTSVGPGQPLTLVWSAATMPSGANNSIIGYTIAYRNDTAFTEDSWSYYDTIVSGTSATIIAPATVGTYYFCPCVETDSEGYRLDASDSAMTTSSRVAVQITASNTGTPTNVKVNNSSTLYIGETNTPALALSWKAASDGTNNPVKDYTIYKDGVELGQTTSTTYSVSGDGSYTVLANPTVSGYGSGSQSTAAKVIKITDKPVISFTSQIPAATGTDLIISWSAAKELTGVSVSYLVYQNSTLLAAQTSTNYTFDITKVAAGESFILRVVPRYIGASNSYTEGSTITTTSIIRADSFEIPSSFWAACYDAGNDFTEGIYNYAHAQILLKWNAITPTEESQGSAFTYTLEQQTDASAFISIGTYTSASTKTISLSSYAEGTAFGFRMKITNEFGISAYSDVIAVQKVVSPSLTNLIVSNISAKTLQSSFEWERKLPQEADDLEYKVDVIYGNQSYVLSSGELNAAAVSPQVGIQSIDLNDSTFATAMSSLYEKVITQKTVYPTGTLRVILNYKHFKSAQKIISNTFSFNYITEPENFGEISYLEDKAYYNSGDTATVLLTNFSWKDAAGGTLGGEVSNYLSSSYSTNKFVFSNGSTSILAPSASSDLSITLTLKTQITYADATKEYTTTKILPFNIARWVEESVVIDGLVLSAEETQLEGYLQLPEKLCSSAKYNNLLSITPILISPQNDYIATFYTADGTAATSFVKSDLPGDLRVKFAVSNNEKTYSDVSVSFSLTFTNTSNNTLVIKTNSYRYFVAEIDMAVRKGRVGINVANDFTSDVGDSALQINAGSQTGTSAIVEVLSDNSNGNTTFLCLKDGQLESNIFSDGTHLQIENFICSTLYSNDEQSYLKITDGKISVNGSWSLFEEDGELKFNTSKVLTDSNYSDYFGGAISPILSSNLDASKVLVSDSNGKIAAASISNTELNALSGITSNIQSQLNKKFDSTVSQSSKTVFAAPANSSGVPSFRQLTYSDITAENISLPGNSITANVFMGNGIRYSSTAPTTNLAVGQIWLKPKG